MANSQESPNASLSVSHSWSLAWLCSVQKNPKGNMHSKKTLTDRVSCGACNNKKTVNMLICKFGANKVNTGLYTQNRVVEQEKKVKTKIEMLFIIILIYRLLRSAP
jgi:hypothetical protein